MANPGGLTIFNIGIADDQQLFLRSLSTLIDTFGSFRVVVATLNGEQLLQKLSVMTTLPDIALIDVNMPIMDGVTTVRRMAGEYPQVRTIALSMKDDDYTIINMLRAGCSSYLLKDIHPDELERALTEVATKGFYNADAANINFRRLINRTGNFQTSGFSEREINFLQLACSDRTYRQIAAEMHLSERTIDGYRESLFEKLKVQSRVGMALEAIRRNLVTI
jgi:DNA-binding NarL/FixJ family response regulator